MTVCIGIPLVPSFIYLYTKVSGARNNYLYSESSCAHSQIFYQICKVHVGIILYSLLSQINLFHPLK